MFDDTPIRRELEAALTGGSGRRLASGVCSPKILAWPAGRRRRGSVAAGFALAMAAVAALVLPFGTMRRTLNERPRPVPLAMPSQPQPQPQPSTQPPPQPRSLPPPASPTPTIADRLAAPAPARPARKAVRRPAADRDPPRPTAPADGRTPHLTGEALRRALIEDAQLTRRLNLEALDRTPPTPAR